MKLVAGTPPNVTFVVWVRLTPVIVTGVPTGPFGGLKLVIFGVTRKATLLLSIPLGVVTSTVPVVAPANSGGDQGSRDYFEDRRRAVKADAGRAGQTGSQNVDGRSTLPEVVCVSTNGPSPTDS